MKKYLTTLSERDKWMLIGTALCLILYCYYLLIYSPLNHQVDQKSMQLKEKIATLAWMNTIKHTDHKLSKKQKVDNNQLLTLLSAQLKENAPLKEPYELRQNGSGDIELTFNRVNFNLFIAWLDQINKQYTMQIKQFNAERTKTEGYAHVMILINTN